MRSILLLLLGMAMAGAATAQPGHPAHPPGAVPSVTLPPGLDRVLRDYEQGWRARDAGALAALFTPDGFVLCAGHPPVRGRDAVAEAYRGSGGPLHLRALAYAEADTVAYIIGAYGAPPGRPDAGKFIRTLRRPPGGAWLIAADLDNRTR